MDAFIRDTGITVVYEPDSGFPIVDIVIVHGLQGHPYKTWACRDSPREVLSTTSSCLETLDGVNGSRKSSYRIVPRFSGGSSGLSSIDPNLSNGMKDGGNVKEARVFWPKDLLPIQCPKARILVYGYDTKVTNYLSGPTNETSIHSHGKDLLSSLAAFRKLDSRLILIAHSLGGIVVKEMLASSSSSSEDRLRNVVASTASVIFLGTPHRGSPGLASLGDRARSLISLFRVRTNPAILDALRLKTKDLERAQESFSAVWNQYDFRVKTFKEGLGLTGVNLGPFGEKVVSDDSSLLGDVRERAETIQANHMAMCRFTGLDDPNYGRICAEITSVYDSLAGLKAPMAHSVDRRSLTANELTRSSRESRARATYEREETCLQSLLFPNMNQRTQNLENPAEGTCSWFFKHEAFVDWLTNKNQVQSCGLLWLRGKPGSGKSTLLKEAFFKVRAEMSDSECHVASFFFNAKGDDLEHSPTGMLRSILHQLCSQNPNLLGALLDIAQSRRALCGENMAPWDEAELRAFFKPAIIGHKKRIIIFIDAIDECDSNSVRDVADFWRETTKTAHHAGVQLSVCLSGRHFPAINVNDCPKIIVEEHNYTDIVSFVKRRLDLCLGGNQDDREAIQNRILEKSGGIFLWVSLVIKDVLRKMDEGKGLKSILMDLDSVPRKLEDLFSQLLTAEQFSGMAVRMFQWALLPAKPLRLHEWHHILAFIGDTPPPSLYKWRQSADYTETNEQLEKRITHLSRGLLGFNIRAGNILEPADESMSDRAGAGSLDLTTGDTRVVQVIHESIRQYFMEGPGFAVLNPSSASKPLAHAHLSMMSVCLDYILIHELDALVEARIQAQGRPKGELFLGRPQTPLLLQRLESEPFFFRPPSVASFGSAGSHDGRQSPVEPVTHSGQLPTEDTIPWSSKRSWPDGNLASISPSRSSGDDFPTFRSLKEALGSTGSYDIASSWLADQSEADQGYYDTPAAHATPSVTGCSQILEDYPALLSYATFELFTHALKADEDDIDPSDIIGRFRNGAWQRWKALREDADERTELLYFAADLGLSSWLKANIWEESNIYLAIEFAIENNNAKVFGKLLDAFPSARCVRNDSSKVMTALVSASDAALLQTYLSWHSLRKHDSEDSPVKILPASEDHEGRSALHHAVIRQNKAVVSVLLQHGADISAVDSMLRTPLHIACMDQLRSASMFSNDNLVAGDDNIMAPRSDIIELLLTHHAQIDAVDKDARTPLNLACSSRATLPQLDTSEDVVSPGVRLDRADLSTVDMLLKHGADVTIKDCEGYHPLHRACWNGVDGHQSKVSIVSKLLDYGSPVNAFNLSGMTPLHIACHCWDAEMVEELLRRGADPVLRDPQGRTPLHLAIVHSNDHVVETLLPWSVSLVNATDNGGSTPLHLVYSRCLINSQRKPLKDSTTRWLLAHGA